MKIIIDAMGGDNAPEEIVKGAVKAKKELNVDIVLVGIKEKIEACLANENIDDYEIVDAREIVTMEDDPSTATRTKKDSSMTVALNMLKNNLGDAVVSAGSTGALLTGATLITKRIKGIRRAALAPVLPIGDYGEILIDCGANVECTPEYLLQFAFMGSFYMKKMFNCPSPRVGLMNVGTEDTKGDELRHQTFALLKNASEEGRINFVGNIEGSDAFKGNVEVIVTDGFTGNILLKTTEGVATYMTKLLKGIFMKNILTKVAALICKDGLKSMKKKLDVNEVGGTAMLGISKPVIKAHGSSKEKAIFAAIRQAVNFTDSGIINEIEENIDYMKVDLK